MSLKIPIMQFDNKINPKEGKELLEFAEKYIETFQDNMAEQTHTKAMSTRFLGYGACKILIRRRENFSDDEIEDPEFFYIQKYKEVISRLVEATEYYIKISSEDLPKLKDLREFFERQGYLTKKQMNLISFLLRDYQRIQSNLPKIKEKINDILHHHIKKDFMKADTAQEIAKMLTTELKGKEVIPKKKMFFSLSQIRDKLSS